MGAAKIVNGDKGRQLRAQLAHLLGKALLAAGGFYDFKHHVAAYVFIARVHGAQLPSIQILGGNGVEKYLSGTERREVFAHPVKNHPERQILQLGQF